MSAQASQELSGAYPPSPRAGRRRAQLIENGAKAASVQALSLADVRALEGDPSPASRAALAAKFGRQYDHLVEGDTRSLAEAVLELLVRDLEKNVRQALAEAVAASANLPHGVATRLARDDFEVARPILQCSPVLSDDDLGEIVRTHAMQYALAVAGREHLSEWLSDLLADTGEPEVVAALTGNPGAQLSVATLRRIAEDYRDDRAIQDRLIRRPALPYELVDQLVNAIGERLEWELIQKRRISKTEARQLMAAARDRATLSIVARDHGEKSIERELRHRFTTGELTSGGDRGIPARRRDRQGRGRASPCWRISTYRASVSCCTAWTSAVSPPCAPARGSARRTTSPFAWRSIWPSRAWRAPTRSPRTRPRRSPSSSSSTI